MATKDRRVVRWTGDHGYPMLPRDRSISEANWRQAGVPADRKGLKTVTWDSSNDFTVPMVDLDFLTEDEFRRYIEHDPDFRVENVEE